MIEEQLHFDVTRPVEIALEVDATVAKAGFGLTGGRAEGRIHRRFLAHDTDALATATCCGFERNRIADGLGGNLGRGCIIDRIHKARHHRHAGFLHATTTLDLVAHRFDGLGGRPDPHQTCFAHSARKVGVLGQEAVARVNRLRARLLGCVQDLVDAQVALTRQIAAQRHSHMGHARVQRLLVPVRAHSHSLNAHLSRRTDDAQGDLATVGDQDAIEH